MTAASGTQALGAPGSRRGGVVRVRQLVDVLQHRLSFVPGLYVLGAIVGVQLLLWIDRHLTGDSLPELLTTTVDSARAVFTALAGGLITSVTLVLSMTLVAVQLASTQFSPRSLRDWLGDRLLQHTVGLALGTTVFSLLALRATRSDEDGSTELIPDVTVIVAVVLGVAALFAVVATVDHITDSLRIDSVARRIADDTIRVIRSTEEIQPGQHPSVAPAPRSLDHEDPVEQVQRAEDAACIETTKAGWVQQLHVDHLLDNLPEGSVGHVAVTLGSYLPSRAPLVWIEPAPAEDDPCWEHVPAAFALGATRTMQQDVGFGVMQLTDIALRALSPGVNDPGTATDVVTHLGNVMLELWARDDSSPTRSRDGRTVVLSQPGHADHLRHAFDAIRRHGANDPHVLTTMVRTLRLLREETVRRQLPGPTGPIDDLVAEIVASADRAGWSTPEREALDRLAPAART
jgi:uncharacterized membrane protein